MRCQTISYIIFSYVYIFSSIAYSQEAEKLFKEKYSKISLIVQPAMLKGFYVSPNTSPTISFNNTFSPQFGFAYNFAQYRNFNFRASIVAKEFRPSFDIIISNQDLNAGYDYSGELTQFDLSDQFVLSEGLKVEYYYPISNKFNVLLGLGASLDIRTGGGKDLLSIDVYDFNTNQYKTILTIDSNEQQVTGSLDISLGFNYKTKYGLIQFEVFNNSQLLSYPKIGVYKFNTSNSNSNMGVYTAKGNYSGVSLTLTPKKGWLSRSKTSKN